MTKSKKIKSHAIIHAFAAAAGGVGAGLAQLPCADSIPLSGLQITMIVSLGGVFGMKITKSAAKAIVLAFASSYAGRTASQLVAGWIPGVGNAINATTAATLTEAMGWYVARQFDKEKSPDEIISETEGSMENRSDSMPDDIGVSEEPEFEMHTPVFNEEDLEDVIGPEDDTAILSALDENRGGETQDGISL